ncbi:AraC family transcriptional regulator [Paenibacillus sp. FSL H8-0332]|uniref:helix-turn-helix domain-containing protein n=1 Tax=Paenibacillus sp. FSL H8-0332 TaxID=2954742 RepID=UPI0030D35B3E
MNINQLFFHIHYCNFRRFKDTRIYSNRISRTLEHHELILVTGGRGSVTVDHKKLQFRAGMLFYIRPGVFHSIEFELEEPLCFLAVHFSYAQVLLMEGQWTLGEQPEPLPLHTAQDLKDYYQIEEIFSKLVEVWNAKLPGYEFAAKTALQQLLIAIYQNNKRHNQNYSTSLKVEKIIGYMQEHVCSTVTLPELAGLVQLSPAYLSRAFKEITGYSPIEFFSRIKMDKAKELILEGSGKKVKEIAGELGYTDEFYFSRIFKRMEGISPSEFNSKNVHGV